MAKACAELGHEGGQALPGRGSVCVAALVQARAGSAADAASPSASPAASVADQSLEPGANMKTLVSECSNSGSEAIAAGLSAGTDWPNSTGTAASKSPTGVVQRPEDEHSGHSRAASPSSPPADLNHEQGLGLVTPALTHRDAASQTVDLPPAPSCDIDTFLASVRVRTPLPSAVPDCAMQSTRSLVAQPHGRCLPALPLAAASATQTVVYSTQVHVGALRQHGHLRPPVQVTPVISCHKHTSSDELTLQDLWDWFLEPGLFGHRVETEGCRFGPSSAFFVPLLSAMRLFSCHATAEAAAQAQEDAPHLDSVEQCRCMCALRPARMPPCSRAVCKVESTSHCVVGAQCAHSNVHRGPLLPKCTARCAAAR